MTRVVIVGASVAGVRTAQALRRRSFVGEIVLIGDDPDLPYDKPPLSKALLAGATAIEDIRLISPAELAGLGIRWHGGIAAQELDPASNEVRLADGSVLSYDHVVVATGARARPSPWGQPAGVHTLRSAPDCAALVSDLGGAHDVVVVGAGFIGSEVAATCVQRGLHVTMVDPVALPMARIVGAEVAALLAGLHEPHGVTMRLGTGVRGMTADGNRLTVALDDGSELSTDVAVVGIGAVPNVEWLAGSGLVIDDGVVCDQFCRAAGQANVWAAGDLARWWHPRAGLHRRVEHWTHACEQAAAVAYNITRPGELCAYDPVDYVWSDQYDWRIQLAGRTGEGCVPRIVGDIAGGRCAALYADEAGAFTGAVTLNWQRAMATARRLLVAGTPSIGDAEAAVSAGGRVRAQLA